MQPINPSANNGFHDKRLLAQRNLWVAAIAAIIIWFVPGLNILIWPVKIFVVIIHEGCHAMLTVLTGGGVEGISINPAGSGQTISLGGDPLFIIPAGYLGATLFGAFTLLLSAGSGRPEEPSASTKFGGDMPSLKGRFPPENRW